MTQTPIPSSDAPAVIAELARIQLAGERRLQRLERLFRWNLALLLSTLLLAAFALSQFLGAASAQPGWPHVAPTPIPEPRVVDPPEVEPTSRAEEFRRRIEALRADISGADAAQMNPFHAITVVLHDLRDVLHETQKTLAVMPDMLAAMQEMRGDIGHIAATMGSMDGKMTGVPMMAEEMRRLNINIDIMTTSIDSTMGRMGRMMPYVW
jgi:hypothetical protein